MATDLLTLVNRKRNLKTLVFFKISALNKLGQHLGIWGKISYNPYISGEKPYEWETIKKLFLLIHSNNISDIAFECFSLLLNWYCPDWKKFASEEVTGKGLDRSGSEVARWAKSVLSRDGRLCQLCGATQNLQAHHICDWANYPALRINTDNGITLCGDCHHLQHPKMGIKMFHK